MAQAALHRSPDDYEAGKTPSWRMFQLAFLLLNLVDIIDPHSPDREHVELIFFPTVGGKTEAYLGVIAFSLLLRRLRARDRPDQGSGSRCCCATRCACSRSISSAARRP